MADELSEEESARALAPLLEVIQRGVMRPATANDVLELTSTSPPRYVLKDKHGRYIAESGKGWTERQREALVVPDRDAARAVAEYGRREHGVVTRVARIRRRGTCGIEAVRLRPDIKATVGDEKIELSVKPEDAMALLAVMSGAKDGEGVQ